MIVTIVYQDDSRATLEHVEAIRVVRAHELELTTYGNRPVRHKGVRGHVATYDSRAVDDLDVDAAARLLGAVCGGIM